MINKFRYKKPASKDNSASDKDNKNRDNVKCGEFNDDTLRRRKDNSVKGETKTDTLKKDKSGGVLDDQTKKQLHVSLSYALGLFVLYQAQQFPKIFRCYLSSRGAPL